MTNREKLVQLIDEVAEGTIFMSAGEQRVSINTDDIADHLIANGVTVQRWIPVTERLPDTIKVTNNRQITIPVQATDGEDLYFGQFVIFSYDNSWLFEGYTEEMDGCFTNEITHWMLQPELPKEGTL